MAATLTSVLLHFTFSTKNRRPLLQREIFPDLFAYMGGVCRDLKSPLLHAGGVADHVHLLVSLGKTIAYADLMMEVKRASSSWIKNARPGMATFGWQDGYFCFSIGHDAIDAVRNYFDRQEEHHRERTFQEEVLAMLKKYGVQYDPKHFWD